MDKEQRLKEIEKIWKKHATGKQNMIATFLPHANQKALFMELNQFMDDHPVYPEGLTKEDIVEAVVDTIKEHS